MKKILIHLGVICLISIVSVVGVLRYLKIYTNHDSKLIEVADLSGQNSNDALKYLKNNGLVGEVIDTVYKDGVEKLAVINQNPAPGRMVKPGRKIYLVININSIPKVSVPDLANKTSLSQARNILIRKHLKIGKLTEQISSFVKSKNDQPILAQYYQGTNEPIKPGAMVERNSVIDLVVGVYGFADSDSMGVQDLVEPEINIEK